MISAYTQNSQVSKIQHSMRRGRKIRRIIKFLQYHEFFQMSLEDDHVLYHIKNFKTLFQYYWGETSFILPG